MSCVYSSVISKDRHYWNNLLYKNTMNWQSREIHIRVFTKLITKFISFVISPIQHRFDGNGEGTRDLSLSSRISRAYRWNPQLKSIRGSIYIYPCRGKKKAIDSSFRCRHVLFSFFLFIFSLLFSPRVASPSPFSSPKVVRRSTSR